MHKIRIIYTKSREAIYIPAIEICEVFERALRRLGINIGYIKGRTVKPSIVCANPLPIGIESMCEICDVLIDEPRIDCTYLVKQINQTLPDGIIVMNVSEIDLSETNISKRVYASVYEITIEYIDEDYVGKTSRQISEMKNFNLEKMQEYLNSPVILVLKKTKYRQERIDIKPFIIDHEFAIDGRIRVTIYTGKEKSLNPEHIMTGYIEYIGKKVEYSIRRTKILYH